MRLELACVVLSAVFLPGHGADVVWTSADFTDSYLPAAVQVLVHTIQQLAASPPKHNGTQHKVSETIVLEIVESGRESGGGEGKPLTSESKLRSLLTALNDEAKRQDYAKYQGFTSEVIQDLEYSTTLTGRGQLLYVLQKIKLEQISQFELRSKLNLFIIDLLNEKSDLSQDTADIKPLVYLSYKPQDTI